MRATSITVSRSAKINIGNYESRDAFASIQIELEAGDSLEEAYGAAWYEVQRQIHEQENIIRNGDEDMPIKKLQSRRRARFPVLGNIRKGSPKGTSQTKGWQGGDELDHWRVEFDEPELQAAFDALYGDEPREIRCMLLYDTVDEVLHAWQESYNSKGELTHRCDGETMVFPADKRGQPCTGGCKPYARLYVWLYELPRVGCMRVRTTAQHDISWLTDALVGIESVHGRLTGIPLILKREEREITMLNNQREKRWMVGLEIDAERWSGLDDADAPIVDQETGEVLDEPPAPEKANAFANPPRERLAGTEADDSLTPLAWWGDAPPEKPELADPNARPRRAEDTRAVLRWFAYHEAQKNGDKPANNGLRGLTVGELNKALESDEQRHAFLEYVFGEPSSKALTEKQCAVILQWLTAEKKDRDGQTYREYKADALAEIGAIRMAMASALQAGDEISF